MNQLERRSFLRRSATAAGGALDRPTAAGAGSGPAERAGTIAR
jgi:hypothetical protein